MNNISTALLLSVTALLLCGGCEKKGISTTAQVCVVETEKQISLQPDEIIKELQKLENEMGNPCSVVCCELYVETVINEGSSILHLPAGSMDEGYATPEDAKIIAAYVMTLSGREPTHPEYIQEGNLYYNGNCGGCHGDDGKGLNGAYPNLTLQELKGVKIHKKMRIKTLQEMLKAFPSIP